VNVVWSEYRDEILHHYNLLDNIFTDFLTNNPEYSYLTIQFYRESFIGLGKNSRLTSAGIIPLQFRDEEIRNSIILTENNYQSAIITTIYYMLTYNAFIVVKAGGHTTPKNILYCSLYGIHDDDYKDACLKDKIGGNLIVGEEMYKKWEKNLENLYNIEELPPFYLFHNREKLKDLFNYLFLRYNAKVLEGREYL